MQKGSANLCSCVHWFLTKFCQFSLPLFAQVESRLESLARVVQKSNATTASSSMQGSPFFRSWNCGRFHFEFVLGMGTAEGSGVALATDALSVTPVKMPLSAIAVSVATVILAETDVSPSTDVSLLWEYGHTHMSRLSPPIISQKLCQWFLIFGGGYVAHCFCGHDTSSSPIFYADAPIQGRGSLFLLRVGIWNNLTWSLHWGDRDEIEFNE